MLLFSSQEEKLKNMNHPTPAMSTISSHFPKVLDADPMNLKITNQPPAQQKAILMGHTTTKITKGGIGMLWSY